MMERLYQLFIAPRQHDEDIRNREVVLNVLLAGTLAMLIFAVLLLLFSWLVLDYPYAELRSVWVAASAAMVGGLYWMSRSGRYRVAAFFLVGLYALMAGGVIYRWGINIPTGELLTGLVIVLA